MAINHNLTSTNIGLSHSSEAFFCGERVLVTGACGTIGSELVRQLLAFDQVEELVGLDNNESQLFFLEQTYQSQANTAFFLADVRDRKKLSRKMNGIDTVFHTAAFKHVTLCEHSPFEAVQTNIVGVQNVISAAMENRVKRVIFTSSDKAVNPTNVMGTSKLMGERLMTAANSNCHGGNTIFSSTRFGNVLGSRGSVFQIFHDQIKRGGPVTITDPQMTRFVMSIDHAVKLVIDTACQACGGEVFITKMPVVRITDLAQVMIDKLAPKFGHRPQDIQTDVIGVKPGEKMYEELMNSEETRRAWELRRYFTVLPAFKTLYREIDYNYPGLVDKRVPQAYHSGNEVPLTQPELADFLEESRLLEPEV